VTRDKRTVERAIGRLLDLRLFEVVRGGGRGKANRYNLLPNGVGAAQSKPRQDRPETAATEAAKPRQDRPETAATEAAKPRHAGHHTLLPLNTLESLPPSEAENREVPPRPSSFQEFFQARRRARAPRDGQGRPGGPWPPIKEVLARPERIGQDKVAAWLDKITLHSVIDGEMRLIAPTKFAARWVRDNFAPRILEAWREIDPSARSVRIEHAARPALAARQEGANAG
jgi:hypothetical protein